MHAKLTGRDLSDVRAWSDKLKGARALEISSLLNFGFCAVSWVLSSGLQPAHFADCSAPTLQRLYSRPTQAASQS